MGGTHWGREEEEVLSGVYNKIFLEHCVRCVSHRPVWLCGLCLTLSSRVPGRLQGALFQVLVCIENPIQAVSVSLPPDCLQAFVSRELSKLLDDRFVVTSYYPPSPNGCPKLEGGISFSIL